jgi:4-hydroxybenzoate polyprenyltransferase
MARGSVSGQTGVLLKDQIIALIEALRPKQWTKNAVVFAALVFDGRLFDTGDALRVATAAILFAMVSSAGYLFNDLRDLEADRQHPTKRNRPLASGRLDARLARAMIAILYLAGLPLAFLLSPGFAAVVLLYVVVMYLYSEWLKHWVIIDVFVIASGFVLRAVAGAVVIDVPISPWLYVCTILLALFIGFAKRRNELDVLQAEAVNHRRNLAGYSLPLLDQFMLIVAAAVVIAYSLYTFYSPANPGNDQMMLTIPFVIYGVFRYLYLVQQNGVGGAPEQLVLEDRPLLLTVFLWGAVTIAILYSPWS